LFLFGAFPHPAIVSKEQATTARVLNVHRRSFTIGLIGVSLVRNSSDICVILVTLSQRGSPEQVIVSGSEVLTMPNNKASSMPQ